MRIADQWKDYEIIDTSGGEKLERWGDVLLIRPDPQIYPLQCGRRQLAKSNLGQKRMENSIWGADL